MTPLELYALSTIPLSPWSTTDTVVTSIIAVVAFGVCAFALWTQRP